MSTISISEFPRHRQSTAAADERFRWPSSSERLSQFATDDRRASLQQVPFDYQLVHLQEIPATATDFNSPTIKGFCANSVLLDEFTDMKHDSFLRQDRQVADDYNLICKDGDRSYADLMTSGTVGGFANGLVINYVTDDVRCSHGGPEK